MNVVPFHPDPRLLAMFEGFRAFAVAEARRKVEGCPFKIREKKREERHGL